MSVPDPLSPDCETGKHSPTCSGDAWDLLKDEPAPCTCECHKR